MREKYINEFAWNKIFSFLRTQKGLYVKTETSAKKFAEGIFWMARTGAQWRELPEDYEKWNSVFKRFNECQRNVKSSSFCKVKSSGFELKKTTSITSLR